MDKIGHFLKEHIWKSITGIFKTSWNIVKTIWPILIVFLLFVTISLWFGLSGPHHRDHNHPLYNIELTQINQTENNDYVVLISMSDPLKECPIEDARFVCTNLPYDNTFLVPWDVSEFVGKSIDNETFIVFEDNDSNGNISEGDVFIFKSTAHVDDDGNPSPGYTREGAYFELRAGQVRMAGIKLK